MERIQDAFMCEGFIQPDKTGGADNVGMDDDGKFSCSAIAHLFTQWPMNKPP